MRFHLLDVIAKNDEAGQQFELNEAVAGRAKLMLLATHAGCLFGCETNSLERALPALAWILAAQPYIERAILTGWCT